MAHREGLNFDEKVLGRFAAHFQTQAMNQYGLEGEQFQSGELILTQKGVLFLELKGVIQKKRIRAHSYSYDIIKAVRTESRGITGTLSGQEFLVIDIDSQKNPMTVKYSCSKTDCVNIRRSLEERISFQMASIRFQNELLRLLKSVAEANLKEIVESGSLRDILIKVMGRKSATPENYLKAVLDMTRSLISEGFLDGIIDDSYNYISRISLERKTVQYQVAIDFTSLMTQLKGKGIVLESLECPSCKGKLEYPESGSIVSCKFCGASVSAIDVFDKFKGLLDI